MMLKFFKAFFLVLLFVSRAEAVTSFLDQGFGARALALGGSFTGLADDATAIYWNPAGLSQLKQLQVQTMYVSNIWDYNYLFGSAVFPQKFGSLAVAYASSGTSGIEGASRDTNNRGQSTGITFSDVNNLFIISFARAFNPRFSGGLSLKYISENLYQNSTAGYAFDLGFLFKSTPQLNIGFNLQNFLSSAMTWNTSGQTSDALSFKINSGLCYFLKKNLNLLFDLGYEKNFLSYRGGGEYDFSPSFKGRMGLAKNDPFSPMDYSLGFGLILKKTNFDFSLTKSSREDLDDYLSRFSVGLIF